MEGIYIPEPDLYFGGGNRHLDPKLGLLLFGPAGEKLREPPALRFFRTGVIGISDDIDLFHKWIRTMRDTIFSEEDYSIHFPGIGENSPLKFDFQTHDDWEFLITQKDLSELVQDNRKESINIALSIIENKLEALSSFDPLVDYIAIILPKRLLDICSDPEVKLQRIRYGSKSFGDSSDEFVDFRNTIKAIAMDLDLKTQIFHPSTLSWNTNQTAAIVAWNIAVAAYYKGTGIPWKLSNIRDDTCYVGISFYQETGESSEMRSSMAQVFLRSGESLVLRGEPFPIPEERTWGKNTFLTQSQSEKLLCRVLNQYKLVKDQSMPRRIVIHKSSPFTDEEIEGFDNAAEEIAIRDYIAIRHTTNRFYSSTDYPPLRGSLLKSSNDQMYLFTTGFVPILNTYPGHRVSVPLYLDCARKDSKSSQIAHEILALTKLDWNDSNFCERFPVTIGVSRSVGNILAEARAKEIDPKSQYRYYM